MEPYISYYFLLDFFHQNYICGSFCLQPPKQEQQQLCLPTCNGWSPATAPISWSRGTSRHRAKSPISWRHKTLSARIGCSSTRLWVWSLLWKEGKAVVVVKKQRSGQTRPATSYKWTTMARTPRPPSGATRTRSTRARTAQICTWPDPSCSTRSLWG